MPRSSSPPTPRSRRRPSGDARRAGPGPPGGPRGEQPGDRRARRPDRAQRPLAQRVRVGREPRPRAGRAADRGLRRRRSCASRGRSRLDPQRRTDVVDRRHRRPGPPGVGRSRSGSSSADEAATGAPDPLGARRPGLGDRPARAAAPRSCSSSDGDPYLETALSYLPDTELYGVTPADYGRDDEARAVRPRSSSRASCRPTLPAKPILAIAPPRTSDAGHRHRHAHQPGHRRRSTPTTRSCATSTSRPSTSARRRSSSCRRGREPVIPGPGGVAAAVRRARSTGGRRRSSRSSRAAPTSRSRSRSRCCSRTSRASCWAAPRRPPTRSPRARPVTLPIPDGRDRASASSGRTARVDELVAPTAGAASVTFARTDLLGVYTVTRDRRPGRVRRAVRRGDARTRRARRRPPAPAVARRIADVPPRRPDAPVRFAVDLLDVDESRIAPGDARRADRARDAAGRGARDRRRPPSSSARTPATSCGSRSC